MATTLRNKTNERPGSRAVLRHSHMSAYKAREVLGLIRGRPVGEALEVLRLCERDAAIPIAKLLASAVANAVNNDQLDADELYVSTAYADEAVTMKRWSPRARGRATRLRKRSCHVTLVVSRLDEETIARLAARRASVAADRRARRVAASRKASEEAASEPSSEPSGGEDEVETDDSEEANAAPEARASDAGKSPAPGSEQDTDAQKEDAQKEDDA